VRILVVEDEPKLSRDVCRVLSGAGFVPEVAEDGEEAWFLGSTEDYAAIVLDLGLPKIDGISVLQRWRDADVTIPVLILTARSGWRERVTGIDAGADDYLTKPFQMEELVARLHAIVRRTAGKATSSITIGSLTLDARLMRVSVDGARVSLTPLEYRALTYLIYNAGRVVAPHELTEHVYGIGQERGNNNLEVLIGRLRRKIGPSVIGNRRGYGYIIGDEAE